STISITTELESKPYIGMTIEVMNQFGVTANPSTDWKTFNIPSSQQYSCSQYHVPGDYSSAAFLMVAGALLGNVKITGLRILDGQGDSRIISILAEMGVKIKQDKQQVIVSQSEPRAIEIDASDIPDLVPILSVLATQAKGKTRIFNARRLQYKESNRLNTTTTELRKLGASIETTNEGLEINGPSKLRGTNIDPHDDHRIAMAGIVACLVSKRLSEVSNIECIKKSYPNFIQDMISLGAQIECSSDRRQRRRYQ
ncbi:MAG: 3-phosphoshikimate 1-carboxyvinyltransferase, partial [Candidatus Thorarchaeota archaeon]